MRKSKKNKAKDDLNELVRFTKLFSYILDKPYILLDFQTDSIIYTTEAFNKLIGVGPEEKISFEMFLHPEDKKIIHQIHQSTKDQLIEIFRMNHYATVYVVYEIRMKTADGTYKYVRCNYRPVHFDQNGIPMYDIFYFSEMVDRGLERFVIYSIEETENKLYYSSIKNKFVTYDKIEIKPVEIEIMKLAAMGNKESQICKKVNISINLLRYYKKNIYFKFHVSTMAEAVSTALFYKIL
ncbi:MAG TPA: PAS domain-containing protein [Paludibacter sp.]|nr:PAS domain-containing protein [Paludibacter sp.]